MTPVLADITEPIPSILDDPGHPTCVLLSPVFVRGGARRRRLLARWRYLTAAACLAYLVMLGVSFTAYPVSKPGNAAKLAPSVTDAGAPTPAGRPLRTVPREAPPVEVPAIKALLDGDAAQDAALMLRAAPPVTTRPAPPIPVITRRAAPTTRPHRDNDSRPTTRSLTISTTPVASSKTTSPTSTPKRAAP
jgi:hypothetical protein